MKNKPFTTFLAVAFSLPAIAGGLKFDDDLSFLEQYAFSTNRQGLIKERFKPDTMPWFVYSIMNAQNEGRLQDARAPLDRMEWLGGSFQSSRERQCLKARQLLLEWDALDDAGKVSDKGRRMLSDALGGMGVYGSVPSRQTRIRPNMYPAALDQDKIRFKPFHKRHLARDLVYFATDFSGNFRFLALDPEISDSNARRDIRALENVLPDSPHLVEALVEAIRDTGRNIRFSDAPPFNKLTLRQLGELRKALADAGMDPALRNDDFADVVLRKLEPSADEGDISKYESDRLWLKRILSFARTLPDSYASLRTLAIYNLLDLERSHADYSSRDLFLEYLKTPRSAARPDRPIYHECNDLFRSAADLSRLRLKGGAEILKPVTDDADLVEEFLAAYAAGGDTLADFDGLVSGKALRRIAAEAKLVSSSPGEAADAAKDLSEGEFAALSDKVELDFLKSNPRSFSAGDAISLDLRVKNVPQLRVAVYDIDAFRAGRDLLAEVPQDVDLDGCVPTSERTVDYSAIPRIRRHVERLDFPELKEPGLYVIECSGAGVSSRALIRKGALRVAEHPSAAGNVFFAIGEDGAIRKDASLWLDGTTFKADDDGAITVPFAPESAKAGRKTAVVRAGRLASTVEFIHGAESYSLSLSATLPPESVVAGEKATMVLRPSLSVGGSMASVSLLGNPCLTLTLTDASGNDSVRKIEPFAMSDDAEPSFSFTVPARLARARVVLSGTVRRISGGEDEKLSAECFLILKSVAAFGGIGQALLRHDNSGYTLELRGIAGEPLADRRTVVHLRHKAFSDDLAVTLQTGADGRVALGHLDDIASVKVTEPVEWGWDLNPPSDAVIPAWLNIAEGEAVELPLPHLLSGEWPGAADLRTRVSLLMLNRRGEICEDCIGAVSYTNGVLRVVGLPSGDYSLTLRAEGRAMRISVTKSIADDDSTGVIVGGKRLLDASQSPLLPRIEKTESRGAGDLTVTLANASPDARLHVFAHRYVTLNPYYTLAAASHQQLIRSVALNIPESAYVSGRDLGDKIRYILDRRGARRRPGNMLERPSLILSPWSETRTETRDITLRDGGEWDAAPVAELQSGIPLDGSPFGGLRRGEYGDGVNPSFDFMRNAAMVALNLRPDKNGVVTIPGDAIAKFTDVSLILVDGASVSRLDLQAPFTEPETRDIRFASKLDPETVYLAKNETIPFAVSRPGDLVSDTGRSKAYMTIPELYGLLRNLGADDATFAEFGFVADWPTLPMDRRIELYGKYACHELDLFLYRKDRKFFDSVVTPNLANKRFKQFIDHWLLGDDLSAYAADGVLQTMNPLEQCLLAERVPGVSARLARHYSDWCQANHPSPDDEQRLFRIAMDISLAELEEPVALSAPAPSFQEAEHQPYWREYKPKSKGEARGGLMPSAPLGMVMAEEAPEDAAYDAAVAADVWSNQRVALGGDSGIGAKRRRIGGQLGAKSLARDAARRNERRVFWRPPEATREWVEQHYYRKRHSDVAGLGLKIDRFWLERVQSLQFGSGGPFLPRYATDASSFTEKMAVLAFTDLPFEKDGGGTAILYRESVSAVKAGAASAESPVHVVQRFVDPAELVKADDDGEEVEKYVQGQFVTGRLYGLKTVFTNPSGRTRRIEGLIELPQGAVPVGTAMGHENVSLSLEPYGAKVVDRAFYFPMADASVGALYPASAVAGGKFAGQAETQRCEVVAGPLSPDPDSWEYVSQEGSDDDVIRYVRSKPLTGIDLLKCGWRMESYNPGQSRFTADILDALASVGVYSRQLWRQVLRDGCQFDGILGRVGELFGEVSLDHGAAEAVGPWFKSSLLTIEPEVADVFEHREYWPLFNARAHSIASTPTIANTALAAEYREFLKVLGSKPSLDARDRLLAAVYFIAQDRIDEAKAQVALVRDGDVETRMQLDYIRAYLAFSAAKVADARAIAEKYRDYPVPLWRGRFREVLAQADEIEGRPGALRFAGDEARAKASPSIAMSETAAGEITVTSPNVASCTVSAYPMDIEMLFSKTPFGSDAMKTATFVRPAWSQSLDLGKKGEKAVKLPASLTGRCVVLVAASDDGRAESTLTLLPGTIDVQVSRESGLLLVRDAKGKALPAAYVKVYAKDPLRNEVRFYKDGYTDLRGIFDYASVSLGEKYDISEFAVLVLHDTAGAKTFTTTPPNM